MYRFNEAASATRLDVGDKVLGGLAESRNLQNKIFNQFHTLRCLRALISSDKANWSGMLRAFLSGF